MSDHHKGEPRNIPSGFDCTLCPTTKRKIFLCARSAMGILISTLLGFAPQRGSPAQPTCTKDSRLWGVPNSSRNGRPRRSTHEYARVRTSTPVPNPFFYLGQACFKRIPSKPTMRALSWQMGGAAPPPTPPLVFYTRASLLQTNRFQTYDACIVFAYGGGDFARPRAVCFYSGRPASL